MKKQIAKKIILRAITFVFVLFFLQTIIPSPLLAADELNWDNPNKNSNNPYKFKPTDILNSQLIMQVVGCTGVVDKVSGAVMNFVKGKASVEALEKATRDKIVEAAVAACKSGKGSTMTAVASILNMNWTDVVDEIDCKPLQRTRDGGTIDELIKLRQDQATSKTREECFNGIAITLAKNQLTAMTRETVNWINTGFNGNPMYVQNITSLTNSIERNILEKGISQLGNTNKAYPYGSSFSSSMIRGYNTGARKYGATNFLDSLTSDLAYFITDKDSYYSSEPDNRTALEKAQHANNTFANDFSTGGWNGWLALTQRDQNNPLGFTMQASQYLADRIAEQSQEKKDELYQNNGFLSQKKCVLWELYDNENAAVYDQYDNIKTATSKPSNYPNSICIKDEIVTPGSIIKEKLSYYVNSPERQLELADSINDSLNSLFSALVSKLQNQGLSSLSSEKYQYTLNGVANNNMGIGSGYTNDFEGGSFSSGSGYRNGSFDLTRDLGNTYIYNYKNESLGNWDAKNNSPKLYVGVGPVGDDGKYLPNSYYTVTVAGNTKLFNEGYSGWAVGDRAFWDGKNWQNWKKDIVRDGKTIKTNPIEKRGVIQIQNDYIVAAKELLSLLPNIMPKMGELDYCIPGPNPNWQANSSDAQSLFQEYSSTLSSDYQVGGWLERDKVNFKIGGINSSEYNNYKNIFKWNNIDVWNKVISTPAYFGELNILANKRNVDAKNDAPGHQAKISSLINKINVDFNNYYKVATEMFNKLYGKDGFLQKEFYETENSNERIPNPSYLPMAEEGLNITKDILSYDQNIKEITEDYKNAITQANTSISKLNAIKAEVSKIIKIAQDRRDENLVKILNEETIRECNNNYTKCMSTGFGLTPQEIARIGERGQLCSAKKQICESKTITEAQYKIKYASCLAEEDILYYDYGDIINTGGGERCNDGIDNDLDGLVDMKDPDCAGYTGGNTGGKTGGNTGNNTNGICAESETSISPNPYNDPGSGDECNSYSSQNNCNGSSYTREGMQGGINILTTYNCQWYTLN